jgi:hypothetical protein
MTARCEIAKPRWETGAQSPEARWVLVQYGEDPMGEPTGGQACGSAIAAEPFMSNAG